MARQVYRETRRRPAYHLARTLGVVGGPLLVPIFLALLVAAENGAATTPIALVTFVVLLSAVPAMVAFVAYWTGRAADLGFTVREERHLVAVASAGSAALALGLLAIEHAGGPLTSIALGLLVQTLVLGALTTREKVSYHAAGGGALAVGGWFLGGPLLGLPFGALALAIGWSRCYLGRHSTRQVIIGLASNVALVLCLALYPER